MEKYKPNATKPAFFSTSSSRVHPASNNPETFEELKITPRIKHAKIEPDYQNDAEIQNINHPELITQNNILENNIPLDSANYLLRNISSHHIATDGRKLSTAETLGRVSSEIYSSPSPITIIKRLRTKQPKRVEYPDNVKFTLLSERYGSEKSNQSLFKDTVHLTHQLTRLLVDMIDDHETFQNQRTPSPNLKSSPFDKFTHLYYISQPIDLAVHLFPRPKEQESLFILMLVYIDHYIALTKTPLTMDNIGPLVLSGIWMAMKYMNYDLSPKHKISLFSHLTTEDSNHTEHLISVFNTCIEGPINIMEREKFDEYQLRLFNYNTEIIPSSCCTMS